MKTVRANGFQPNELFWARSVKALYAPVVQYFGRVLSERLLPPFSNLELDAERFAEEEFQRLGALPYFYDTDGGNLAELANDNGVSWYTSMVGVKQSVVNLHAVGLRHLFEQQLYDLVRRVPLVSRSRAYYEKDLKALCKSGIDVENFNSWSTLEELRLVCHAIKHGPGSAASQLKGLRSDLFVNAVVPPLSSLNRPGSVLQPLAGEGIYLRETDIEKYAATIENFWNEISERLEQMAASVI